MKRLPVFIWLVYAIAFVFIIALDLRFGLILYACTFVSALALLIWNYKHQSLSLKDFIIKSQIEMEDLLANGVLVVVVVSLIPIILFLISKVMVH